MSNYAYLERYIPVVQFMGEICGKNYEIILHDVSTPERSVIAACNGHLSGRRVGDPMTELAKELIQTGAYHEHNYVANYEGRTRGGKRFVSSTFFIKEAGELRGLICVNHDVEDFFLLSEHLDKLMHAYPLLLEGERRTPYTENLDDSISELSSNIIHTTVRKYDLSPADMTSADKLEIIRTLESQGVFSTKGSVGLAAKELHISEPTVYRYLQRIRNGKG
nr:PAS domain-containing protein [uncultured Flavonifractor sp.]